MLLLCVLKQSLKSQKKLKELELCMKMQSILELCMKMESKSVFLDIAKFVDFL